MVKAGGRFRSYVEIRREDNEERQVRKFDKDTWERRFANLVEPTLDIADFLAYCVEIDGGLSAENSRVLNLAVGSFQATGEWPGLPRLPVEEVRSARRKAEREQRITEEITRLEELAERGPPYTEKVKWTSSYMEKSQKDRQLGVFTSTSYERLGARFLWRDLACLYEEVGRYKEMENALIASSKSGGATYTTTYISVEILGMMYLDALSTAIRGRSTLFSRQPLDEDLRRELEALARRAHIPEIELPQDDPPKVTPEALGHTTQEVRKLADEALRRACDLARVELLQDDPQLEIIQLSIEATLHSTKGEFDEYDKKYAKLLAESKKYDQELLENENDVEAD